MISYLLQERDLKAALEDEAQKREAILSQKRILETTIATMQVEMDNLKRQLEDAKRKIDQLTVSDFCTSLFMDGCEFGMIWAGMDGC